MPPSLTAIVAKPDALTLERDELCVQVSMRPFSFTIRRAGRSLLRSAGVWVGGLGPRGGRRAIAFAERDV
jgi:hypothetical protein